MVGTLAELPPGGAMNEFDPEVLYSDLCGEFRRNGIAVRVLLFRLDVRSDWSLWVINATGGSFV